MTNEREKALDRARRGYGVRHRMVSTAVCLPPGHPYANGFAEGDMFEWDGADGRVYKSKCQAVEWREHGVTLRCDVGGECLGISVEHARKVKAD